MPIPVQCSGCQTRLNAPDTAAGKHVKCPSCQALIPVGGAAPAAPSPPPADPFAFDDESAPPPAKKSGATARPAARPAAEPIELDDDEDEKPKAKKPAKKKRRDDDDEDDGKKTFREKRGAAVGGPPVAVVLVFAGLIGLGIVGGVCYTAYALFLSGDGDVAKGTGGGRGGGSSGGGGGGKAGVPSGWKEFTSRKGGFKAYFPGDTSEADIKGDTTVGKKKSDPTYTGAHVQAVANDLSSSAVAVGYKFGVNVPAAERDRVMKEFIDGFRTPGEGSVRQVGQREVTWLGQKAKETVLEISGAGGGGQTVIRTVVVGTTGYIGVVSAMSGRPKPEVENGFFDNFEVVR